MRGAGRWLEITDQAPFHKHSPRFSPCSAGFPELRRPPPLLHFAPKLEITAAPSSSESFGAGKGFTMDDEARATGLGPVPDRDPREQSKGPRRGRRSPYRHPRQGRQDGGGQGGLDLSGPTYAALDLGTNNCRLLVARATRDGFRVIDAFSRIIRLGEGITSSGVLSEPAILRAVDALRVCRAKMRNRGVTRSRLIATEACRSAGNGLDFLERIRSEVGIELGDRRSRDRGAAGRHRLHAAGRSGGRGCDPVRYRWRLLRARSAEPLLAHGARTRRIPRSRPGSRSRSAS